MIGNKIFDEKYKNLNSAQKEAVNTIDGPVLVVAGPGTGKTTILTLRIAEILRKTDTPASGILAITYTNAGVKAMREKLREIIGSRAHEVYIHTFHSFASAMISEYPDHFLRVGDFKQMTDVEEESLIRKIIEDKDFTSLRPIGRPDAYISSIIRAISDAKKDALTPKDIREHANREIENIKNDESNLSTRGLSKGKLKAEALDTLQKLEKTILFADVYERYESEKENLKLRDYDDLIMNFLVTLREDNLFLRLIQERFLYLLVDEHQDTNDSQNFIVGLIAEFFETPNIFVVGDEKQAIYRFQGASVENFLRLQKKWPKMKVINLDTNYRSHQCILDASFAMIEKNYETGEHKDLRIKLKSGKKESGRPIDVVVGENSSAIEEYLADELSKIRKCEPKASVAIITRRNRELERVLRFLESKDIPVSSERSVDIFHHPIGVVFFDLLEYIVDSSRVDLLSRTLISGMWGISFGQSVEIIRNLKKGEIKNIENVLPGLINIRNRMMYDGAVGGLIHIAEKSGFVGLVSGDPSFVHVWRGIVTLAESLTRDSDISNPTELLEMMLKYRQSAENKTVKVSVGAPDLPIKVMTAHSSKGLEFDYVFIPYANEETWVGRAHGSSFVLPEKNSLSHEVKDLRRLFYVAITRAKRHATILYATEETDGKILTPLRFVGELDRDNIVETRLNRTVLSFKSLNKSNFNVESDNLLINEAKNVLLSSGLSVTALNHFLECPSKFLYESILKMPQAPSLSSEKGSALHEAISKIWSERSVVRTEIEKIIISVTSQYLEKSLLSWKDKERLKEEITKEAPSISASLMSHFALQGRVSTERWFEFPLDIDFNKQKITIPIHGKLDVVIESVDGISVFDYKTRQGMSVSAIRGQTKNSDANYFRQLVFYKMLIQSNFSQYVKKVDTSLVFISPNEKGKCQIVTIPISDEDIKNVKLEIKSLIEAIWGGKITENYCDNLDCQYCSYRKILNTKK